MALRFANTLRLEITAMIVIYLLVCLFILCFSPAALLYVGHDVSPVLDGVWRIENGQIPHKDFSSILGYGYLLQQAFFLKLFRFDFVAFAVSSVVLTTVVFCLFLSFYRSRFFLNNTGPFLRIYYFLLLLCLGLGQYHFGVGHTLLTYANLYNRYSFLCLFAFSLQTLSLKDLKRNGLAMTVQLLIGALLLNYLFFVKLTYFLVAVGLLSLYWLTAAVSSFVYWRLLLASLFVGLFLCWAFKADLPATVNDYRLIASARSGEMMHPGFVRYKLLQYYNLIFLLCLLWLLAEAWYKKMAVKWILLICYIGVCAVFLQFTNWGSTDIVMLTFVPAVALLSPVFKNLLSSKIFLALCCFFLFKNLRSIYYLSKVKATDYAELKSPYLSRFYTNFTEVDCKQEYAPWVMSGVALVDKNKKSGDRIFSFSFDNPFPFLTHTLPPKHVSTVWQYATTYTDAIHIAPQQLFSEVDLLLIPRCPQAESASEMMRIYGSTVNENYSIVDSNGHWNLFRKTKPL